jgi:hypothetical protein
MKQLLQFITNGARFLSEAVLKIFSPNRDHFPATGAQPFTGKIKQKSDHS